MKGRNHNMKLIKNIALIALVIACPGILLILMAVGLADEFDKKGRRM